MKETRPIMGMPITVVIPQCPFCLQAESPDSACDHRRSAAEEVFQSLREVDERFSPFKEGSEVSRMRRGEVTAESASGEMREVLRLCGETQAASEGYFDAWASGEFDPSGVVKGWSLRRAAALLRHRGFASFSLDGGGDIEARGQRSGAPWRIGIRNPFDPRTIIKILAVTDRGVATSGNYIRGEHIFDPWTGERADAVASVTVIGPDVLDAARFATAAFAMGERGIAFLATLPSFEGYMVRKDGRAVYTPGFAGYVAA
jgi:thiamine biosynthesis lipoprotein